MLPLAVSAHGSSICRPTTIPRSPTRRHLRHSSCFLVRQRTLTGYSDKLVAHIFRPQTFRIRSQADAENYESTISEDIADRQDIIVNEVLGNGKNTRPSAGVSFLAKIAIALGLAATATVICAGIKEPALGSSHGFQFFAEGSSSSAMALPAGFTFKAFGYRVVLPEYAPGWIYFWLLMAAGCGLFISEEALNIWVGISIARMLTLDGTWQSFAESFSRNAPYIISTILWVYWGVCISDLIPFYLGKLFTRSGASADVCSKLGIGKERAQSISRAVQKYGNLSGLGLTNACANSNVELNNLDVEEFGFSSMFRLFTAGVAIERLSVGARNPTGFLAGAMGVSAECFFAGVCAGGLITLPIQFGIGFLLRQRPLFALATVATAVGIWTVFPYAVAASTALYLFLRRWYSTWSESSDLQV
ncbi:hypothetical protein FEM48_Zijuj09G0076100 [Ziziphus jujuba var. spinosa]|uniref:Uncharacterized protein n=1 Tax=Ziziphus jujuba var. spinosa TaxID=714518 RepID=A0A978URP2_ZIZJJ|nr:hypothetical protein FEM48_Zijuj09G0076100 [Ziziphus jujuba var. spinosa]